MCVRVSARVWSAHVRACGMYVCMYERVQSVPVCAHKGGTY